LLLLALVWPCAADAGEEGVHLEAASLEDGPLRLESGWRFRDRGAISTEADWRPIAPGPRARLPVDVAAGTFRLPLVVPPELRGRPLALRLWHPGASEVFLDGTSIGRFGTVAAKAKDERPHDPRGQPILLAFSNPGRHELTIDYSSTASASRWAPWLALHNDFGLRAEIDLPDRAFAELADRRKAHLYLNLVIAALCLGFAVLHGVIFAYHPKHPGNLFFSLFAISGTANGTLDILYHWGSLGPWPAAFVRQINIFVVGAIFLSLLLFLASLRSRRAPRIIRWLAIGFAVPALSSLIPALAGLPVKLYLVWLLAAVATAIVLVVGAFRERVEGARPFLVSVAGFAVISVTEIAKQADVLGPAGQIVFYGLGVFLILSGSSIFLARRIAEEGRELERLADELEERVAERTAELTRSEREALAANRAKSAFLATMSHEIRTPMNAVVGLAELLSDAELPRREREMAATLRGSAVSLLNLIDEILDLSRIEAGRLELESRTFEVEALVREVVELFAPQAARDGLELTWRLASEPLPTLSSDPARLRQILVNLVGNALKFTERGSVEIVAGHAGGELVFEVHDTGIGIAAPELEGLFQPFSQGDASTTRRFGGAGLGLAICRELTEALGGTIEAESEFGRGSTFRLRIPAQPAPGETEGSVSEVSGHPVESGESDRPNILLAEDNPVNQMVTLLMLERLGHQADTANDGEAALEALEREAYDVVFLDLHMPKVDGLEVARRLRRHGHETRIIALTASALPEDRERCREAGMDDFLAKPIQLEALRAALRRAERGRAA